VRAFTTRTALALSVALLAGLTLSACGGGSHTSDVVPKSTPDIVPPADNSAEKAAGQTTSTSTSATGAKGATGEASEASSESGSESSEESSSKEASSEGTGGGAAGGTSAEKEKAPTENSKGTAEPSPTGGANAPSGK
jgi:hypothetical protein